MIMMISRSEVMDGWRGKGLSVIMIVKMMLHFYYVHMSVLIHHHFLNE